MCEKAFDNRGRSEYDKTCRENGRKTPAGGAEQRKSGDGA